MVSILLFADRMTQVAVCMLCTQGECFTPGWAHCLSLPEPTLPIAGGGPCCSVVLPVPSQFMEQMQPYSHSYTYF